MGSAREEKRELAAEFRICPTAETRTSFAVFVRIIGGFARIVVEVVVESIGRFVAEAPGGLDADSDVDVAQSWEHAEQIGEALHMPGGQAAARNLAQNEL